jgi:F-type H+-transporting ATPase subunit alpha
MLKKRSQRMRMLFTQFKELESFTRFGSRIEESSRGVIDQGKRIQELLRQDQFAPLPVEFEFLTVLAGIEEIIRKVPLEEMETFQQKLFEEARKTKGGLLDRIRAGEKLSDEEVEEVRSWMESWIEEAYSKPEGEAEEESEQEK